MEENHYRYISQSIQRAIDVLLAFTSEEPERGVTELSEALNIPKSTVHRLVVNLEARGLLERDQVTEKYRLGLKILELGMRVWNSMDLRENARPYLEELSRQTGETAVLGILSDGEVIYLDKVDSSKTLSATSSLGQRRPLHCTALGKALLAWLPDHEAARIVAQKGLTLHTPNTIVAPERLYEELATIRQQRYALDLEEFEEDLRCIGTPIMDATGGVIASISISGPRTRFNSSTMPDMIELMQSTAEAISRKMGCTDSLALASEEEALRVPISQG